MTIQPIGSTSAAIYLTAEDLEEYGITGSSLTAEQARTLLPRLLSQTGLTITGTVEVEAFPGLGGVLAFVHLVPPQRCWLCFDRLEDLLAALAQAPPEDGGASLYLLEGRYWLSLSGKAMDAAARLSEFGDEMPLTPLAEAVLLEHVVPLASGDQFARFRSSFRGF